MEEKVLQDINKYPHTGSFHSLDRINIPNGTSPFTVAGCITGCGLAQCYGVKDLPNTLTKEELLKSLSDKKFDGVGAIIATLGKDFYSYETKILKLGFELMSEYPNYRHGADGKYLQRIYILKL